MTSDKNGKRTQLDDSNGEVDLLDLWNVTYRHRRLIPSLFALGLIASAAVHFLLPKRYRYATALEVGSITTPGAPSKILVDTPETVVAKALNGYTSGGAQRPGRSTGVSFKG